VDTSPDHTLTCEDAMAFELLAGRLGAHGGTSGTVPDALLYCICFTFAVGGIDADLDT
jgi:hypothetical protein